MTYRLFLDDERIPGDVTWVELPPGPGPWIIVRTQDEFESYITKHGMPDVISFDNDLGRGNGEGRKCVKWLVEQVMDGAMVFPPHFTYSIHSKNVPATIWMHHYLERFFRFITENPAG